MQDNIQNSEAEKFDQIDDFQDYNMDDFEPVSSKNDLERRLDRLDPLEDDSWELVHLFKEAIRLDLGPVGEIQHTLYKEVAEAHLGTVNSERQEAFSGSISHLKRHII